MGFVQNAESVPAYTIHIHVTLVIYDMSKNDVVLFVISCSASYLENLTDHIEVLVGRTTRSL